MLSLESNDIIPCKIPVTKQKTIILLHYTRFFFKKEQREMFFLLCRGGLWVTLHLTQNKHEVALNPPCGAAERTRIRGAVKGWHRLSQPGLHDSVHEIRHNGLFRVWRQSGVLFKAAAAERHSFSEATMHKVSVL